MWSKTAKKFRRKKSSSSNKVCDADIVDICKGKTPSADDASEYNSQPDICKNNSSSTESEMTISNGPSASGEEERQEIAHMPSDVSDEFASDDDQDGGEHELDEVFLAEEAMVDDVNDKGPITTDETPSVDCNDTDAEPISEVASERIEEKVEPTSIYRSLESMMLERVNSINKIHKMLKNEVKLDNGKSFSR